MEVLDSLGDSPVAGDKGLDGAVDHESQVLHRVAGTDSHGVELADDPKLLDPMMPS